METPYLLLVIVHLVCAVIFGGAVAFEVLILPELRKRVDQVTLHRVEDALESRAVRILPFVLIVLYATGVLMLLRHFPNPSEIFNVSMGRWLSVKLALAAAVILAVATALTLFRFGRLTPERTRVLHWFVFVCVMAILVLAKAMFYL